MRHSSSMSYFGTSTMIIHPYRLGAFKLFGHKKGEDSESAGRFLVLIFIQFLEPKHRMFSYSWLISLIKYRIWFQYMHWCINSGSVFNVIIMKWNKIKCKVLGFFCITWTPCMGQYAFNVVVISTVQMFAVNLCSECQGKDCILFC